MSHAVVIGAGIAGLASAALLAKEGHAVTVLEARPTPGGRAGLWQQDGFAFDTGPSWYLMPEVFDHFFQLLGTSSAEQLKLVRLDPAYRVFFEDHAPIDITSDRAANLALFDAIEPGAGRRLDAYLASASDTYTMAKRRFLYTTYASLLPLLRPDMLTRLPRLARLLTQSLEKRVGGTFDDVRLRQILGYPAVFLGSSPRITPSMYHLMSHLDLADGVHYPVGGFARLIEAIEGLAIANGAVLQVGARVTAITTADDGGSGRRSRAHVTGVTYRDDDGTERHLDADLVVSTADLHHTEHALLPPGLRSHSPRWWRARVPGPSAVLVYLGVRGRLPELEHHSLLFTRNWDEMFDRVFPRRGGTAPRGHQAPLPDPTSLYVCRPSATDPSVAPPEMENLFVLVPVPADPAMGRGGHGGAGHERVEAVADAAIAQVAAWAGVPDLAQRIVVRRTVGPADFAEDLGAWQGTALGPAHTLRQSAMFRPGNASRRVRGLLYAGGSVTPGIGLPMCLISAELVIKRLRGDTSTTPLSTPFSARPRAAPGEPRGGRRG